MLETLIQQLAGVTWLEGAGLVFGLLAVVFLIFERVWTWPCGIAYVICSLVLFVEQALYGQILLHLFFFAMNAYGWYYWIAGNGARSDAGELSVTRASLPLLGISLAVTGVAALGLGYASATWTDASVPWWDSSITALSFLGMWLSARKLLENWVVWFVVDVIAAPMFFSQGLVLYAVLYLVYVPMAVAEIGCSHFGIALRVG